MHNLPHEALTGREMAARFPGYNLPANINALFQPEGGFLASERCIVAHVQLAQSAGADIHAREGVQEWEALPSGGVRVRTAKATYTADKLVITAGPWARQFLPMLQTLAQPERQTLAWLQPYKLENFLPDKFPVFNLVVEEGRYYGFPVFHVPGFKFGRYHHLEEMVDPETIDREGNDADERVLRQFAERYFPDGAGATMALKVCMFTNSPDEHFIMDTHPDYPQVSFAAGFSGHGYKFCSVVGEVMADLAMHGDTRHDISLLRYGRFAE
jgi:sarcosine oxidase